MKTLLRRVQDKGHRHNRLLFVCPGCKAAGPEGYDGLHLLPINTPGITPSWEWDGNLIRPTLSPSIHTEIYGKICHSFLENGIFRFLEDSTHPLAGRRVPIPDLPAWAEEIHDRSTIQTIRNDSSSARDNRLVSDRAAPLDPRLRRRDRQAQTDRLQ
jgi:hypothetical protein